MSLKKKDCFSSSIKCMFLKIEKILEKSSRKVTKSI